MSTSSEATDLEPLRVLSGRYPTIEQAVAEIAGLRAALTLPKPTVHVISDVHGEFAKLRHVINNASGSLRPLVAEVFGGELSDAEMRELISVLY